MEIEALKIVDADLGSRGIDAGSPVLYLVRHLGRWPLTKDCQPCAYLACSVAAHVLFEFGGLTGDAARDRPFCTFSRNSPPPRRNCACAALLSIQLDAARSARFHRGSGRCGGRHRVLDGDLDKAGITMQSSTRWRRAPYPAPGCSRDNRQPVVNGQSVMDGVVNSDSGCRHIVLIGRRSPVSVSGIFNGASAYLDRWLPADRSSASSSTARRRSASVDDGQHGQQFVTALADQRRPGRCRLHRSCCITGVICARRTRASARP